MAVAGTDESQDPQCRAQHIEAELTTLLASSTSSPVLKPLGPVSISDSPYEACDTASAVLILTEWDILRYPPVKQDKPMRLQPQYADSAVDCSFPTMQNVQRDACLDSARDHTHRLAPQPECPLHCEDCAIEVQKSNISNDNIDWPAIAKIMRGERWVFDGRGVCDQAGLEKVGFLVHGIGRADTKSKLR